MTRVDATAEPNRVGDEQTRYGEPGGVCAVERCAMTPPRPASPGDPPLAGEG